MSHLQISRHHFGQGGTIVFLTVYVMPIQNLGANHQIWFPSCYNQTETYQRETIKEIQFRFSGKNNRETLFTSLRFEDIFFQHRKKRFNSRRSERKKGRASLGRQLKKIRKEGSKPEKKRLVQHCIGFVCNAQREYDS